MKRFRLRMSTLMLLVVIAALSLALVVQQRRAARREADLQLRHALMEHMRGQHVEIYQQVHQMELPMTKAVLDQLTAAPGANR